MLDNFGAKSPDEKVADLLKEDKLYHIDGLRKTTLRDLYLYDFIKKEKYYFYRRSGCHKNKKFYYDEKTMFAYEVGGNIIIKLDMPEPADKDANNP